MDTSPLERLTQSVSILLSRRALAGGLGLGALALPRGTAADKRGKKDKKTCKAHDTAGCQLGHRIADCGGEDTACPGDSEGLCATTTGKAAFCLNAKFTPVTPCKRDADCVSGDLAAVCVLCGTSTICGLSF